MHTALKGDGCFGIKGIGKILGKLKTVRDVIVLDDFNSCGIDCDQFC